jgi:hypothetical protein
MKKYFHRRNTWLVQVDIMIYKDIFYFGGKIFPLFFILSLYINFAELDRIRSGLGNLGNKKPATQKRSGLITKHKQTSLFL